MIPWLDIASVLDRTIELGLSRSDLVHRSPTCSVRIRLRRIARCQAFNASERMEYCGHEGECGAWPTASRGNVPRFSPVLVSRTPRSPGSEQCYCSRLRPSDVTCSRPGTHRVPHGGRALGTTFALLAARRRTAMLRTRTQARNMDLRCARAARSNRGHRPRGRVSGVSSPRAIPSAPTTLRQRIRFRRAPGGSLGGFSRSTAGAGSFTASPLLVAPRPFMPISVVIPTASESVARLLRVDATSVRFRTRPRLPATLSPVEFLRRLMLHVLAKGFVRIRHFACSRQPMPRHDCG
jgi:hypothetical protein